MKVYIAGPMTGLPDHNYPAFNRAEAILIAAGYEVVNPASIGQQDGWEWEDYMKAALALMVGCDAMVTLPGWEYSRGAQLEVLIAANIPWFGKPRTVAQLVAAALAQIAQVLTRDDRDGSEAGR